MGDSVLSIASKKRRVAAWIVFIFCSSLACFTYVEAWIFAPYQQLLSSLGICCLFAGLWVMSLHGWRWRALLLVTLVLAVGQWWFVELMLVQAIWRMSGFAP